MPQNKSMQKCIYVQNDGNRSNEIFDLPPNSEHIFSASYFHEKAIIDVSTIIIL